MFGPSNFLSINCNNLYVQCINITINYYHLFVFLFSLTKITQTHNYNTRLAAKVLLSPKRKNELWIFNIRFQGPSVRNSIDEDIKSSFLSL